MGNFRWLAAKGFRINAGIAFKNISAGFISFGFVPFFNGIGIIMNGIIFSVQSVALRRAFLFAIVNAADKLPGAFERWLVLERT